MASKKKKTKNVPIDEHVRIAVDIKLRDFLNNHEQVELEFPNSLTSVERQYIHVLVRKHGLKSKSKGKADKRFITIYKRNLSTIIQADCNFNLSKLSYDAITHLLSIYPLTTREKSDVEYDTKSLKSKKFENNQNKEFVINPGRLTDGIASIPLLSYNPELKPFRMSLPIFQYKDEIINLLKRHQVILVSGETGSGKTTQIPQYIMDEASNNKQCCRIICTQPRRISAISVSERVSYERGVRVGQDVGYQIRLESQVSPQTALIYCTTGVLLRTLMGSGKQISNITHIIVDEIHERDKFTDYLLIVLRDLLPRNPSLKLILMSATMDTKVFTQYFNDCPYIEVPGRLFPVKTYFLEDILQMVQYTTPDMKKSIKSKNKENVTKEDWTVQFRNLNVEHSDLNRKNDDVTSDEVVIENYLKDMMDQCLQEFWTNGSPHLFGQILHLILNENIPVNYQHRSIGCTILMLCAGRGFSEHTEHILNLGADAKLRSCNNWTAYDWAINCGHKDCAELIVAYTNSRVETLSSETNMIYKTSEMTKEVQDLLDAYSNSFNSDEAVDNDLILHIIKFLHANKDDGGILIFLPGYEDIIELRDLIIKDSKIQEKPYQLFILHSNMHTADHKQVFKKLVGIRKIIISTNIAQTSITIEDVVYVIDSGKVKEVSFDGISNITSLRSNWISKACAKQRAGRAGRLRSGVCYYLFSSARYNEVMKEFTTPDILRTPLQELCLQTKLLAPVDMSIATFLQKAIESPPPIVIKQAVQLLKLMGALDSLEELTELGIHLVNIPLDPKLSKMIMYGVVLKCLDPILTIASCLAHNEPFIVPTQSSDKQALANLRKRFSANTYSDHMVFLQVFQAWQKARQSRQERKFCTQNFINTATMEQILNTRAQLLGHLRASGFVKAKGYYDIKYLNLQSENWGVVKAALVASTYPSLCRLDKKHMTLRTQNENKVNFHPSSSLKSEFNKKQKPSTAHVEFLNTVPSEWMIYEEKCRVGAWCFIRVVTFVTPVTVALFGGPIHNSKSIVSKTPVVELTSDSDSESEACMVQTKNIKNSTYSVDDWAQFSLDNETATCIHHLRQKWNALFIKRMTNPSKAMSAADEAVLDTVTKILREEDLKAGFIQPAGIGQRPLSTEEMTPRVYQTSSQQKTTVLCSGSNYSSRAKNNFNNRCDILGFDQKVKVSKYFLYKMVDIPGEIGTHNRYKLSFTVSQKFSVQLTQTLQSGNQIYIIYLIPNKYFDGIAEVVKVNSEDNRVVHLNFLSRLRVPVAGCGLTSINGSCSNDAIELDPLFGKTLMDYIINFKPSYLKGTNRQ